MGGIEGNPTWAAKKRNCPSGQVVWVGSGQSKAKRTGCVSLAFASGNCKD